jgi:hypothetical protein
MGCETAVARWDELTAPKAGRMSARAEAVDDPDDPCAVKPEAGYRGLENRLYRVEIRDPGPLGVATFVWSRDNGSVVSSVTGFPDGQSVELRSLGKDRVLRFAADDRVELVTEESEFAGLGGTLTRVVGQPDEVERIVELADDVSVHAGQHRPRLRRWDHDGDPPVTSTGWTELELGVQVRFSAGPFEVGDHWLIPARVALGDVEGFTDASPRGIDHHRVRLALVRWSDSVTDCRRLFPSLCGLPDAGRGCATVTVGDGVTSTGDYTSIQAAVDAVPDDGPARIEILPGHYRLTDPVRVTKARLTITGCDRRTQIDSQRGPAFALQRCSDVTISALTITAEASIGAVTVVSSRQVTIEGCTIVNGPSRPGDGPPSSLELLVDPAGPAIAVQRSADVAIVDNILLGAPALSLQIQAGEVRSNILRYGGAWVTDGSAHLSIVGNTIGPGRGPGVGIGAIDADGEPAPGTAGVRSLVVADNRIVEMEASGISTVQGPAPEPGQTPPGEVTLDRYEKVDLAEATLAYRRSIGDADRLADQRHVRLGLEGNPDRPLVSRLTVPVVGDIEQLVIRGNLIERCALDDPQAAVDPDAGGGIVLRDVIRASIVDNEILGCGHPPLRRKAVPGRAVGVFLSGCETTEVSGNRIIGNGTAQGSYVDFTVGGEARGPNPLIENGIRFEDGRRENTSVVPILGLLNSGQLRIGLPRGTLDVCFTYLAFGQVRVSALDEEGNPVAETELSAGLEMADLHTNRPIRIIIMDTDEIIDGGTNLSILSFCAGSSCRTYQGGIIAVDQAADGESHAIAVHGNTVESPAGQTLLLLGIGTMEVADNRLTTTGRTLQACQLEFGLPVAWLPRTVLIYDAGMYPALGNWDLLLGGEPAGQVAVPTGRPTAGGSFLGRGGAGGPNAFAGAKRRTDPEPGGRVLFTGNQVTYADDEIQVALSSVICMTLDDLGFHDNQIRSETLGVLVDAMAFGPLVRMIGNSLTEPFLHALWSGVVRGSWSYVAANQAAHCLSIEGELEETSDNHIMGQVLQDSYCLDGQAGQPGVIGRSPSLFRTILATGGQR